MNKTKKIIIIVISCIVVLAGIYFALHFLKQKNQNSKTVGVYAVSEIGYDASNMWDNSTLSGNVTVNSEQKVYVGKKQSVSEIKVTEGQSVKAGDVLLVYDTTANDLQLQLQKSELELSRVSIIDAQRELEKLKQTTPLEDIPTTEAPIIATDSDAPKPDEIPDVDVPPTREELKKQIAQKEQEIKSMQTQYEIAQVKLQMEELQNSTGEVLANFDGVVKSVTTADEAASSGNPVLVVSAADGYLVESQIGELAMSTVRVGDTVSMYCYDTGMNYDGTITEISTFPADGYSNYNSKVETYYPIKIALNDATDISQNMYMEITLNSGSEDTSGGFYLSKAFMKQEGSNYYVMKDVDGRLKKTYIKVGNKTSGDAVLVLGGLTMQDYIAFPYLDEAVEGVKTVQKTTDDLYN
ncbi:efflux RND transporter periplasmic adaptor subunit [Eubacterium sp. MSJ-33]|uniref:efflux RND transporter periplasmic adaptor subunit n=1 Tax=Eubacterium sp. MSJ-33 TaxID=2841528 RepID=UPI0015AF3227|nr:efflux RND transporter periplasmic adaptor subunit [Eubacterium sp. MSJ-33]QWT53829.1 efflux RND transporter periplasmic adaptor subunit [Eubacterium sp. MSJ-33]